VKYGSRGRAASLRSEQTAPADGPTDMCTGSLFDRPPHFTWFAPSLTPQSATRAATMSQKPHPRERRKGTQNSLGRYHTFLLQVHDIFMVEVIRRLSRRKGQRLGGVKVHPDDGKGGRGRPLKPCSSLPWIKAGRPSLVPQGSVRTSAAGPPSELRGPPPGTRGDS
jgi:hypothetical protein